MEYSDKTLFMYADEKKIQRMYRVTEEGRLEPCIWDQEKTESPHAINITGCRGIYSKEFNRFYRIDGEYDISEIHPNKTRPGKIDYLSVGLMIHNKELFMLDTNKKPIKVEENGYVFTQKYNSSTPP